MLLHLRLRVITVDDRRSKLVDHRRQKEDTMKIAPRSFPRQDRILGFLKGASGGVEPHPLRAGLDHLPDHADRRFQACHEGVFCLGKVGRTVRTLVKDTATMRLRGIGRMRWQDSRVARWALAL
jgi:hypothetical protein